jgi:hypothetical protein
MCRTLVLCGYKIYIYNGHKIPTKSQRWLMAFWQELKLSSGEDDVDNEMGSEQEN